MINLTDTADIHLSSVINENTGMFTDIRLSVTSGGCSGFNYDWQLTSSEEADDHVIDLDLHLLGGFNKKDIFGQRLMIDNPNVKSTCGCGESFQV